GAADPAAAQAGSPGDRPARREGGRSVVRHRRGLGLPPAKRRDKPERPRTGPGAREGRPKGRAGQPREGGDEGRPEGVRPPSACRPSHVRQGPRPARGGPGPREGAARVARERRRGTPQRGALENKKTPAVRPGFFFG